MSKFRKPYYTQINPTITPKDLGEVASKTGNVYESLCVMSKRAQQITSQIKEELHGKLNDFSNLTDNFEEIQDNREQAEVSRFYEKLPDPTLIATTEFMDGKVFFNRSEKTIEE